ncbi:MAG TPA: hypothetical protein VGT99_09770, partial [Gammaproteobacteria bacterium]|nr:hypothetical protein [Gammaproteobacteria bacterium]
MSKVSLLFAAAAFAMPALADTHISYVDDAGQPGTQMYVKGGKVRIEGGKDHSIAIYDVASNRMTVLMPEQNKYLVFDEQTAQQMGAEASAAQQQMQAAMKAHQAELDQAQQQMQAAMAQMTPEQRAQAQQMLAAQGSQPGSPAALQTGAPKVERQDLGTTETVAGHGCRDVQMVINGRPGSTLCVSDSP